MSFPDHASDDRRAALELYARLRARLAGTAWQSLFLMYGTLLGAVRDGDLLADDADVDCAYLSRHREQSAAHELRELAFALIEQGFAVRATPSSLTASEPARPGARVKIFHLYLDDDGTLRLPFGTAGPQRPGLLGDGDRVVESELLAVPVALPPDAPGMLELLYGPDWRTPDPGFDWSANRTGAATDGRLGAAEIEEIYWADFYARAGYDTGSKFCELVCSRAGVPDTALDIGCGDGRDSFALARAGFARVVGIDRSHVGLRHAQAKAAQLGLGARISFEVCDVSDLDAVRRVLGSARSAGPLLFYARFFLHSITDELQRTLLREIAASARPGDWFAAEFRTDRDELATKTHGEHYRRFQNGPAFGRTLAELYGFHPFLEQEGNGFSPYRGEDPYLYRVIAGRH